jgi:hypothetical protein
MEELFLFVLQFLAEFFLYAIFEFAAWLMNAMMRKLLGLSDNESPLANALVSAGFAFLAGLLSLYFVSHVAITNPAFRIINLVISPLLFAMMIGQIHKSKTKAARMNKDVALNAGLFVFVLALTRLAFGK